MQLKSLLSLALKALLCVRMMALCQWMWMQCKKANSLYVEDVVNLIHVVDLVLVVVHVVLLVLLVVVVNLHVVDLIIVYVAVLAVEIRAVVLVVVVCRPMQTRASIVVNLAIGHVSVSKNNVTRLVCMV